jgi:hypothetical protein
MLPSQSTRVGYGVTGMSFMKFTLTYDGSLPASGNSGKNQAKWRIRSEIDPQLRDLWANHPALKAAEETRAFPISGSGILTQLHHSYLGPRVQSIMALAGGPPQTLDLCGPIERHGAWFRPLVRETYALHCGLKIQFLRKEAPGKVYQAGDLDGRIKTIIDALTMPQHVEQIIEHTERTAPIYCLLEDDSMVSGLQVESERLLTDKDHPADYVRLIIEVDVRVRQTTIYNQSFLG